jgi:hypothetical protein
MGARNIAATGREVTFVGGVHFGSKGHTVSYDWILTTAVHLIANLNYFNGGSKL